MWPDDANPDYLSCFEHERVYVGGKATELSEAEADYLAGLGEERPGFCERGYRSLKLARYCGVIRLGNRILEILPKIDQRDGPGDGRDLFLRLLQLASDVPLFEHLPVGQSLRRAPLLNVFITAFFDAVTDLVRGGLYRQYQVMDGDLNVVRGRILVNRQFSSHFNRPDRLACQFDELTPDHVWNRAVKAGIRAVRPWIKTVALNRRWIELMAVFDEVDDQSIALDSLKRLVFNRQAVRYRRAIEWVGWILSLLSPAVRAGAHTAPALLFNMDHLFQSAVASLLRRRISPPDALRLTSQGADRSFAKVSGDSRSVLNLRPDLVLRRPGEIVAIGDTKWKRLDVNEGRHMIPQPSDLYQMHAYATAFRCERVALIYPWHAGLEESTNTTLELPNVGTFHPKVDVICIDLRVDSLDMLRGTTATPFGALLGDSSASAKSARAS